MKFGLEKCVMFVIKKGKVSKSDGIKLPNDIFITSIHDENGLSLKIYIQKSSERSIRRNIEEGELGTEKEFKTSRKEGRNLELDAKVMHWQHF